MYQIDFVSANEDVERSYKSMPQKTIDAALALLHQNLHNVERKVGERLRLRPFTASSLAGSVYFVNGGQLGNFYIDLI